MQKLHIFRESFLRMLKRVKKLVFVFCLSFILVSYYYIYCNLYHFDKNRHISVNGSSKIFTAAGVAENVFFLNWSRKTEISIRF